MLGLINNRLVRRAVLLDQRICQYGSPLVTTHLIVDLTYNPNLPQDQSTCSIDKTAMNQEVSGLIALAAGTTGVYSQVRKQAVFR